MRRLRIVFGVLMLGAMLFGVLGVAEAAPKNEDRPPKENPDHNGPKENPNDPGPKPGCAPSNQQPKKCKPTPPPPPDPGTCQDTVDNEPDGFTDADDPDCQVEGCVVGEVNTCDETNDDSGPEPGTCQDTVDNEPDGFTDADDPDCQVEGCVVGEVNTCDETNDDSTPSEPCAASAGDPGLLTDDTLGETLYDGGLSAANPLVENPSGDGVISGPLKEGGTTTPLEVVTDEAACAVDLLLDPGTMPVDL